MKNLFLKLRRNWQIRKNKSERKVVSLSEVESVGILVNNPDFNFNKKIDAFVEHFKSKGIKVSAVIFLDKNVNRLYEFSFIPLYKRDISIFGAIKDEEVKKFIKTPFDYLYSLNYSPFLPFEYILASSHAKCRVGRHYPGGEKLLDMMIDLKDGTDNLPKLLEQILHYQNKI